MDTITAARQRLEGAEEAYADAEARGVPAGVLDDLVQAVDDAERAYFRAVDFWEPIDVSGVIGAGGLVYSDADPGL